MSGASIATSVLLTMPTPGRWRIDGRQGGSGLNGGDTGSKPAWNRHYCARFERYVEGRRSGRLNWC
jgi:hypothetical protein